MNNIRYNCSCSLFLDRLEWVNQHFVEWMKIQTRGYKSYCKIVYISGYHSIKTVWIYYKNLQKCYSFRRGRWGWFVEYYWEHSKSIEVLMRQCFFPSTEMTPDNEQLSNFTLSVCYCHKQISPQQIKLHSFYLLWIEIYLKTKLKWDKGNKDSCILIFFAHKKQAWDHSRNANNLIPELSVFRVSSVTYDMPI